MLRTLRLILPGILLLGVAGYRMAFPPTKGAESHLVDLPHEILGCPSEDLRTDQTIIDDLDSDDILIRRYRRPDGVPVWVVLIYFVNTRLGGHDPQLCYRSQGFRTETLPVLDIGMEHGRIAAEQFIAARPGRAERVATFWYAPGGRFVTDAGGYRNRLFLEGLRENRTYGVFARVSTLESGREGEAEDWNRRFVAELTRYLPKLIRE